MLRQDAPNEPAPARSIASTVTGTFHCCGCDLPLYASKTKFDSGTGWRSFTPLFGRDRLPIDHTFFDLQTEAHCRPSGDHLGHVFDDGPRPTGRRHCINGVAMMFKAKGTAS